ncbi:MAG: hypothetical protein R3C25_00435 [Hyphomonadaceae bacterium]
MSADPAPIRTAPLALWRAAQTFLGVLYALFGDPAALAHRHTLTAKAHAHMASWLRCAEAMLRRLLLIEAGAYPKPNTRPLLMPARRRVRTLKEFWPGKPQEWRVSFRMFAGAPRAPKPRKPSAAAVARRERLRRLGAKPGEPVFIFREQRPASPTRALSPPKGGGLRHTRAAKRGKRIGTQDRFWVHERDLKPLVFRSAWPLAERYEALIRVFNDPAPYARRLARRLHATPHRAGEVLAAPPEAAHRIARFEAPGAQARSVWRAHFSSA